MYEVVPVLI